MFAVAGQPGALDRDGRAGLDLGITGAPETFAVDAMGKVVAKAAGRTVLPAAFSTSPRSRFSM